MAITWRAAALTALGAVAVVLAPAPVTVLAWMVLVLVLVLVDVALAASPRAVRVTRQVPRSVRLGEPCESTLTLTNLGRRTVRGVVRDAWPPSLLDDGRAPGSGLPRLGVASPRLAVHAAPGEGVRVRTTLRPRRRGTLHAEFVALRCLGPLGLAGRQASLPLVSALRVLPPFRSRRHLPSRLARLRELDGRAAVLVRSAGTEFDSLRTYVDGDDVRSIDWRATARRGDVVVRTWRPERDRRVMIVLDTGRTSAIRVGDETRLEASIETALLLGVLADRAGDRVDVLGYDRAVRARVAGVSRAGLLPAMAEAMSGVQARLVETDWTGVSGQVDRRLSQRALVVLLTSLDPGTVEGGLLDAVTHLGRTHQVLVASITDPDVEQMRQARGDVAALFDAAAAERTQLERAAVGMRLRRRGVEVVEAAPGDLPPAVADAYLALKAAGRL